MHTTNVQPKDLSYHNKSDSYDVEIVGAIPFHAKIQKLVADIAHEHFGDGTGIKVLDLGAGTGLTSEVVRVLLPKARYTLVDFSTTMLDLARQKLGANRVNYVCADYAEYLFEEEQYDLVISVIGLHHQTDIGKESIIRRVHKALRPSGIFLLGDLVTHADPRERAMNDALHFHHIVKHSPDRETLADWAHHHMFLNQPTTSDQHLIWIHEAGFSNQELLFSEYNTALMMAVK